MSFTLNPNTMKHQMLSLGMASLMLISACGGSEETTPSPYDDVPTSLQPLIGNLTLDIPFPMTGSLVFGDTEYRFTYSRTDLVDDTWLTKEIRNDSSHLTLACRATPAGPYQFHCKITPSQQYNGNYAYDNLYFNVSQSGDVAGYIDYDFTLGSNLVTGNVIPPAS
jgi:hypothetical protein